MTVFEAYITNLGKYAEGQLVGETLKFPATTEEVQSLLKNIGVDGVRYSKTNLYNDPSGASMQADSHLDDINRVALKLLNYDFVKECIGKSEFSIQTPQGEFTWKNTNEFLDENSPYYNANVKGMKTGTMASS